MNKFVQAAVKSVIDALKPRESNTVVQWRNVATEWTEDFTDTEFKIGQEVELVLDLTTGMPYTMFGKRGKVLGVRWCQFGPNTDDGDYEYAIDCYPKLVWEFELCEVE